MTRSGRFENRIGDRKRTVIRFTLIAVFVVVMILIVVNAIFHRKYSSYKVVRSNVKLETTSQYLTVGDDRILRYSTDGASLMDTKLNVIWNDAYSMEIPKCAVCGQEILIYDQGGTALNLYNETSKETSLKTDQTILKAAVSEKGTVAVLTENGSRTGFYYYSSKGTELAAGESTAANPGTPVDLAISPDGQSMTISYFRIKDGESGTTLNFYRFGGDGSGRKNNLVGSDSLNGILVPTIYYFDNSHLAALKNNGFSIYSGTDSIEETASETFDQEITSAFYDKKHLAFTFQGADSKARFVMKLYNMHGRLMSNTDLDLLYSSAHVSGSQIILYDSGNLQIFSMKGFLKYAGKIKEGNIKDVIRLKDKQYLVVTDEKMEVIELK